MVAQHPATQERDATCTVGHCGFYATNKPVALYLQVLSNAIDVKQELVDLHVHVSKSDVEVAQALVDTANSASTFFAYGALIGMCLFSTCTGVTQGWTRTT